MPFDISGSVQIEVVGESSYRSALRELAARTPGSQARLVYRATLACDPENPYDHNAVKVMIEGRQVGHLPRELAALVAGRSVVEVGDSALARSVAGLADALVPETAAPPAGRLRRRTAGTTHPR